MNAGGALVGAVVHVWVDNPVLAIVLGILLVFAGIIGVAGYADRMRFGRSVAWLAGAVSGAFGGLVGNQGGIRSAAMLGLGVQGPAFVATATAIGIMVDAVRMPVYFIRAVGRMFSAWPAIIAAVIGVVLGTVSRRTHSSKNTREAFPANRLGNTAGCGNLPPRYFAAVRTATACIPRPLLDKVLQPACTPARGYYRPSKPLRTVPASDRLASVAATLAVLPVLIWRLLDEERLLSRNLPGYLEYCEKVRWRLIPRVF